MATDSCDQLRDLI